MKIWNRILDMLALCSQSINKKDNLVGSAKKVIKNRKCNFCEILLNHKAPPPKLKQAMTCLPHHLHHLPASLVFFFFYNYFCYFEHTMSRITPRSCSVRSKLILRHSNCAESSHREKFFITWCFIMNLRGNFMCR